MAVFLHEEILLSYNIIIQVYIFGLFYLKRCSSVIYNSYRTKITNRKLAIFVRTVSVNILLKQQRMETRTY